MRRWVHMIACRPEPVHQHSLILSMSSLYLVSPMNCAALDVSNIVRTFHAPRRILALDLRRLSFPLLTSCWRLSSGEFMLPTSWLKSAAGSVMVVVIVLVSVTCSVFTGWGRWPCPNPNLEDQVLISVWPLPGIPVRHV